MGVEPVCHGQGAFFLERKIDVFLALPPDPQELRARKIGHEIVNSALDRPWSQHFCCVLTGNREFVRNARARESCSNPLAQ